MVKKTPNQLFMMPNHPAEPEDTRELLQEALTEAICENEILRNRINFLQDKLTTLRKKKEEQDKRSKRIEKKIAKICQLKMDIKRNDYLQSDHSNYLSFYSLQRTAIFQMISNAYRSIGRVTGMMEMTEQLKQTLF